MKLDDLEALIQAATRQAFREKLGPLVENEEERARQKKTAEDTESLGSSKKSGDLDEAEDDEEKKDDDVSAKAALGKDQDAADETPSVVMPTEDDMAEANVDHIINMLNMLRSGKSTKDENVKKELGDYFDGLQPGDRQALFVLLSGLTQILTSGVDGGSAPAPAKVGIRISAKKKVSDAEEAEEQIAKKASKEDGDDKDAEAEEAPIVVGESQSKDWIRKILERNRS